MTLGDDLLAALPELREQATSMMRDACTITRATGPADPLTGQAPREPVYTGPCKVQSAGLQESNPDAGGHTWTTQRFLLHLPVGPHLPAVDDLAEITAADADPNLVGRRYRVVASPPKSLATAYRVPVEEVVA